MVVNLPYNLREGQIAYAAKVMANFRALLGAYNHTIVEGLGEGDLTTMLQLLFESVVKANEQGNAGEIVFADGETVEQKFAAGTLNAELLTGEGMFYFYIDPNSGHLIAVTSEAMEQSDFSIGDDGHLIYTIGDTGENSSVHFFDLGQVKGDKGDPGAGDMSAAVYDPNSVGKDLNTYTGYFMIEDIDWGAYFLTYDTKFSGSKTYYTESGGEYTAATVTAGETIPPNLYYERLPSTDCIITDEHSTSGAKISDHISNTTGHVLMGPSIGWPESSTLWQQAAVIAINQGSGSSIAGATNTSSWLRIRALGDVPDGPIELMMTFYL